MSTRDVTTIANRIDHNPDGVETSFPYDFKCTDADWMYVYADGDAYVQPFSVSGIGDPDGGAVTFNDPPDGSITTLTLMRTAPLTQEKVYPTFGPFPAKSHEDALDKLTYITQQLQEESSRSFKVPVDGDIDDEHGLTNTFDTVTAMQLNPIQVGDLYYTKGYYTPGTGGATYFIVAGDQSDPYINLPVNGGTATAMLQFSGSMDIRQAGGTPDPTVDNYEVIVNAVSYLSGRVVGMTGDFNAVSFLNFAGMSYGCNRPITISNTRNVRLTNGGITAIAGTLDEDDFLFSFIGEEMGESEDGSCYNNGFSETFNLDLNFLCNGVYIENARRFNLTEVNIVRYSFYGFKTSRREDNTKNGELQIHQCGVSQVGFGESWAGWEVDNPQPDKMSNGRGIAMSLQTADFMVTNCVLRANRIGLEIDSFSNAQVANNHIYAANRTVDDNGAPISSITNNGAGLARVTTSSNHNIGDSDIVYLRDVNGAESLIGFWKCNIVSDTVVDLIGSTYTSGYVDGGDLITKNYNMVVGGNPGTLDTAAVMFSNNYFDAQDVLLFNSFGHTITGGGFRANSHLMIAVTEPMETFQGMSVTGTVMSQVPIVTSQGGASFGLFFGSWSGNTDSSDAPVALSLFSDIVGNIGSAFRIERSNSVDIAVKSGLSHAPPELLGERGAVEIAEFSNSSSIHAINHSSSETTYPKFIGAKSKGTLYAPPDSGDILCSFWGTAADGVDFSGGGAGVIIRAAGDWGTSSKGAYVHVWGTSIGDVDPTPWYAFYDYGIIPSANGDLYLGGQDHYWNGAFVQRLVLKNGIPVPDVIAESAQLFVDEADNALKVLFPNGTIKTLTTNP